MSFYINGPAEFDANFWTRCIDVRGFIKHESPRVPTLSELASQSGVHPAFLSRQFRAAFGVSPVELGRQYRAEWARAEITLIKLQMRSAWSYKPALFARLIKLRRERLVSVRLVIRVFV